MSYKFCTGRRLSENNGLLMIFKRLENKTNKAHPKIPFAKDDALHPFPTGRMPRGFFGSFGLGGGGQHS